MAGFRIDAAVLTGALEPLASTSCRTSAKTWGAKAGGAPIRDRRSMRSDGLCRRGGLERRSSFRFRGRAVYDPRRAPGPATHLARPLSCAANYGLACVSALRRARRAPARGCTDRWRKTDLRQVTRRIDCEPSNFSFSTEHVIINTRPTQAADRCRFPDRGDMTHVDQAKVGKVTVGKVTIAAGFAESNSPVTVSTAGHNVNGSSKNGIVAGTIRLRLSRQRP